MYNGSYRSLDVWKKAKQLVLEIYNIIERFPPEERFVFSDQMRRAALSIPSNIAEGSRRRTRKDYCHFITTAYSSATELESHISIVRELPFSNQIDYQAADRLLHDVLCMLSKLEQSLRGR